MIKKLVLALIISSTFWGLVRHMNYTPAKSQLVNKPNNTRIANDNEIESVPEKNFIRHKLIRSRGVSTIANDLQINNDEVIDNSTINDKDSKNNNVNDDEITQRNAAKSHDLVKNIKLYYLKISAFAGNKNLPDSAQSEKRDPTDVETDISITQDESEIESETANHKKIPCPPVEKIQQAAHLINDAFLYEGTYRITTSDIVFQENELKWVVGVRGIIADSSDEGIYLAQLAASQASYLKNEYAELLMGDESMAVYLCDYGPGDVGAAGLWLKVFVE